MLEYWNDGGGHLQSTRLQSTGLRSFRYQAANHQQNSRCVLDDIHSLEQLDLLFFLLVREGA